MAHVCFCADPWCQANGCRILRDQQTAKQHDQPPFKIVPNVEELRKTLAKDVAALKELKNDGK